MATPMVAKIPKSSPDAANAAGIDSIPVPKEALSKCIRVSPFLCNKDNVK